MTADDKTSLYKKSVLLKILGLVIVALSIVWGLLYEPWYIAELLIDIVPNDTLAYTIGYVWSLILRVPIVIAGGFLWAVLSDIGRGYVFTRANVRRFAIIGKLALFAAVLFFADGMLFDFALNEFDLADLSESLPWLFIAGGSMLLSVIMGEASELKEENDLTV